MAENAARDEESLVLGRGEHVYVVLNRYPYSSGHLMVVPYVHVPDLSGLDQPALTEMILYARHAEGVLREVYRPGGLNLGLNLGECAGAGVAAHLHFHVLPRWSGDANFMTTIGETRVIPESLEDSWIKLRPHFESFRAL
jgi:ATP adenylyltransferase